MEQGKSNIKTAKSHITRFTDIYNLVQGNKYDQDQFQVN